MVRGMSLVRWEAHATSLKLQKHSLEAAQALERLRVVERENTRLKEEVVVLRDNPDSTPTETAFQVPELTLALRRLSDKLTVVEETLLERTKEVVDARSELATAQHEIEAARALAAEAPRRVETRFDSDHNAGDSCVSFHVNTKSSEWTDIRMVSTYSLDPSLFLSRLN